MLLKVCKCELANGTHKIYIEFAKMSTYIRYSTELSSHPSSEKIAMKKFFNLKYYLNLP